MEQQRTPDPANLLDDFIPPDLRNKQPLSLKAAAIVLLISSLVDIATTCYAVLVWGIFRFNNALSLVYVFLRLLFLRNLWIRRAGPERKILIALCLLRVVFSAILIIFNSYSVGAFAFLFFVLTSEIAIIGLLKSKSAIKWLSA